MSLFFSTPDTGAEEHLYEAIAYYRLSKETERKGQNRESDSIANQRKLIHAYVERHPNIKLIGEEYDDGYTGTNYDRPGFQAIMDSVKARAANCVIVKDLSRLGREYIETGKYLETVFPSLGVRFIAINDDVDSDKNDSGDDLIIPIKNIMNESYCRELSKKLRRQFQIQRANGEFIGAFACYGYMKAADDKHRLVIDEFAAEVVKAIFLLKLNGMSQQSIADFLNNDGVLPPAEYKKSQGLNYKSGFQASSDGKWSAVTVRRILANPVYIGTLVQGKRGTPNYKVKTMRVRKPEDWITVEQNHAAIVDSFLFAVVQKMLERDTRTSPSAETVLPLAGMIFCGDCNSSMCRRSVSRGKKVFYYYVCSANKHGHGCTSHMFEQNRLEITVLRALRNQIRMVVETDRLLKDVGERNVSGIRVRQLDLQIAKKQEQIDNAKEFRMKLYEALSERLIERSEYNTMREKYNRIIEDNTRIIKRLHLQRDELLSENNASTDWLTQFSKYDGLQELSREAVVSLIDRIYVYDDKRIRIDFNYRDELKEYETLLTQVKTEVC